MSEGYAPALAAPRAVPPYPRFTSPQPSESIARSPSPSKRGGPAATSSAAAPRGSSNTANPNTGTTTTSSSSSSAASPFTFGGAQGDARERWASLGQAQQTFSAQQQPSSMQQQALSPSSQHPDAARKMMPPGPFSNEAFLGYNDIWGSVGGPHRAGDRAGPPPPSQQQQQQQQQSTSPDQHNSSGHLQHHASSHSQRSYTMPTSQPPDLEQLNTRFDPSNLHFTREDRPFSGNTAGSNSNGALNRAGGNGNSDEPPARGPPFPGIPSSGSLSPRSLLHYHQQQIQAQQAMAMQAAQHGVGGPSNQGSQGGVGGSNSNEEITTVFIVGFPDDMTEREFANMFLFAKGFEASTLKIPSGGLTGPGQRAGDGTNQMAGAGGPYSAVSMPGAGMFDHNGPPGGWDEHSLSLALSRAGTGADGFPPLGGPAGVMTGANAAGASSSAAASGVGPGGKIKQIIGFAKFRTRSEALEARDALNGRKIDTERGCVLKTEMAKKNLHTKQRPVLSTSNPGESGAFAPSQMGGPSAPPAPGAPASSGQFGGVAMPAPPGGAHAHPGPSGLDRDMGFIPRQRPDGQLMGPPPSFQSLSQQGGHSAFDPFTRQAGASAGLGQNNGVMSPSSEGVYGRGSEFFPRNAAQGGTEAARGPTAAGEANATNANNSNNKWPPLGPLDYYEGSQQRSSQQQGQQQQNKAPQQVPQSGAMTIKTANSAPRGPDWSAFGSPPGLYASAAARATEGSSHSGQKGGSSVSSAGPLSPFGENPPALGGAKQTQTSSGPQSHQPLASDQHEDFDKGESTASRGVVGSTSNGNDSSAPLQSPPLPGTEKNNSSSNGSHDGGPAAASPMNNTRPQSRVSTRSRQDSRTTSPVNASTSTFVQRFGSLRIDSPILHQHPRAFSPNPRSPSGESVSMHPQYKSASSTTPTTNATSPTSPYLDPTLPLPSPTSRSFSIDANPPGNTLFVGNLPGSITSAPASTQLEEALRKLFSQKKGFRQMSFRVKSSGPMCFVEFEDVGCAGRALGEANGDTLDGTVKGGLRLSFSKNPLFKSTLPESNSNGALMRQPTKQLLDLDQLSTLEETAYQGGFSEGLEHGKLHGLFEGRQLGKLKGFEVWEEIGYMEGIARFWLQAVSPPPSQTVQVSRKQGKQRQQLESLLELIAAVPMDNGEEVNLFGSLEKLRARFKMACLSLGIPSGPPNPQHQGNSEAVGSAAEASRTVQIHGRAVDANQLNF